MDNQQQLEQAILALEAQRGTLGDTIVDALLSPALEKLAALQAQTQPAADQRKHITVLFADISGFTALSETLDAEDVHDTINTLWVRLDAAIMVHGGTIDKHIGDAVMALWGVDQAREDDPERAIRAALALQTELRAFNAAALPQRDTATSSTPVSLHIRIGINTGPVLLGEIGVTREFTAMGDTVNLASRLEHAAPIGGVLISHDTYRHVHGIFDVEAQAPLIVKGKAEPVQTYIVQGVKPRAFRLSTRGIEGIETRMVGRDVEFMHLQQAYLTMLEPAHSQLHSVTITAEAGMGKSRLLHEFMAWVATHAEQPQIFRGRASQEMRGAPYALLRDVFSAHFQIQDSDSLEVVFLKMKAGLEAAQQFAASSASGAWPPSETPLRAHLIGHLLGFDFRALAVAHSQALPEDARQRHDRALRYIGDYFRAMTVQRPTLLLLEDIHWADDSSLDAFETLLGGLTRRRLLVLCAARPDLFERRPHWVSAQPAHLRLNLTPLTPSDSRALVNNILQKVDETPSALRELVVNNAEGNPFYVEELIKMFIEDGIILKGVEHWQIDSARLAAVRVPPTLMTVLQARFDSLPAPEKITLQRAAMVGRIFWAEAVDFLDSAETTLLAHTLMALAALCGREMIFQREGSTFAGALEYIFKHALLRDAVYESVLKRERRLYHARAAEWLILNSGMREKEFIGLIAEHLERAAQAERAIIYLTRAGANALEAYAYREAVDYFARALALLPPASRERIPLLVQSGDALWYLGEYEQAQAQLQIGLALGQQYGDIGHCADALIQLGNIARRYGDWGTARAQLTESLELAQQLNDQRKIAHALYQLAWVDIRQGAYLEARQKLTESLTLYQATDERRGLTDALNGLGSVALNLSEYDEARQLYLESLALCQELGDQTGASALLVNLGEIARRQGDYTAARQYYEESLAIDHEIGDELLAAMTLGNLGHTAQACGDYPAAEKYYLEGLQAATPLNNIPDVLDNLSGLAGVLAQTDRVEQALEVLGLVLQHPALEDESRAIAEPVLKDLQAALPSEVIEAGLAHGQGSEWKALVHSLLLIADAQS